MSAKPMSFGIELLLLVVKVTLFFVIVFSVPVVFCGDSCHASSVRYTESSENCLTASPALNFC